MAAMASLEFANGQWGDLIVNLATNASHDDIAIRKSSLQTLSYICEEVEIEYIDGKNLELILSALIMNFEKDTSDNEIREICMEALFNTVRYASNIFKGGNGGVIVNTVVKACAL